jgi:thiol-disulfide isomerase/thioredoxin
MDHDDIIQLKYFKYKNKYLKLKKITNNIKKINVNFQYGGGKDTIEIMLFKAEWCGHCKKFQPVWNTLKQNYGNKYVFTLYDSEKDKEEFKKWGVNSYPTIIINNKGNLLDYNGSREMEDMVLLMDTLAN